MTTTETRRSTVQKKAAASDADLQLEQGEVITTIPKIDIDQVIVENANYPGSPEAETQKV